MRRLHLPIQDPCHENWDAMNREDAGRRFCDICTKHVHDLSEMTERTARVVISEESEKGRVCVRYAYDRDGNIKFKPETTSAPTNLWRMTMAAAGMTVALLTGCADKLPDEVQTDRCVYQVGPYSFTAARGEGSCPAISDPGPEPEEFVELGEIAIEPPPPPEPVRELMGDVSIEPPPEPPPQHVVKGKIARHVDPPPPEPVESVTMGEWAPEEPPEQPCEPAAKDDDRPRRL